MTFDKYQKYGAYHWNDIDTSTFKRLLNRSLPLYTRYDQCLKNIPSNSEYGIEIGCGDGALSYLIAQHGVNKVLGCDTDPTAIELAQNQVMNLPLKHRIQFECALFEDCNIQTSSVDVVVLADVIEHLEDPISLLKEIKRVGKIGGTLIVTTPRARPDRLWDTHHVTEYTENSLEVLLKQCFSHVEIVVFMPIVFYRLYTRFRICRNLFNLFTQMGINPFNFRIPFHNHAMLLGVCHF